MVQLNPGSLMFRSLPHNLQTLQGRLDNDKWDPAAGWSLADLCYLRVLLIRTLAKIENHLDELDLNLMRRATMRIDTRAES